MKKIKITVRFESNQERKNIEKMFINQTVMDHRRQNLHSPWSIQQKMIDFVDSYNSEYNSHLHYSKTAVLNEELVREKALDDYHVMIKKENDYICPFY